jgi:HEAT repeat protein
LKALLDDPHLAVRIFAADALSTLAMEPEVARKALDAGLPRALRSSNDLLLERAVSGLVRLQIGDPIGLRGLLQDPSEEVSRAAWHAMHELGPEAVTALPLLGDLWERDSKDDVLRVIRSMGPAAVSFSARIESLAATQSSWERLLTLEVLNAVAPGPKCAALLAEIFSEAKDTGYLREASADGLLEKAEHALAEIPRFVRHLRENDGAIYASAILSHIGAPAAPALIEALRGPDADLRAWAAWTLGGMGLLPAEAKPALGRALGDPSELVRSAALQALERAASADKPLPPRDWPRGRRFVCGNAQDERVENFHLALCGDHAEAGKKGALGQQ